MNTIDNQTAALRPGLVRRMYDWVLAWSESPYAVPALIVIAFAEASFFPIPPDVLLIAMCLGTTEKSWTFAGICTVASVLGGLAGYAIGVFAWATLADTFYRWVPGFTPDAFANIQALYLEWGVVMVFAAGFSPIPFKLFTVASGVVGLPLMPFLGAAALSRGLRFFLVAGLLKRFGEPVKDIIDKYFNQLALLFCVLLVTGFMVVKVIL
ncbi:MAG: DedA family protein [Deltaproteobacteria bacterium]|jgi:membrane protein YqaA with SNARE-associated domain|nr:DedA family protein [Deltaproteobacteria bacterium]MBT6491394.1 DedA family protein [Deltaproteobacteria bacterium]